MLPTNSVLIPHITDDSSFPSSEGSGGCSNISPESYTTSMHQAMTRSASDDGKDSALQRPGKMVCETTESTETSDQKKTSDASADTEGHQIMLHHWDNNFITQLTAQELEQLYHAVLVFPAGMVSETSSALPVLSSGYLPGQEPSSVFTLHEDMPTYPPSIPQDNLLASAAEESQDLMGTPSYGSYPPTLDPSPVSQLAPTYPLIMPVQTYVWDNGTATQSLLPSINSGNPPTDGSAGPSTYNPATDFLYVNGFPPSPPPLTPEEALLYREQHPLWNPAWELFPYLQDYGEWDDFLKTAFARSN